MFNDVVGYQAQRHLHLFILVEWSLEVHVFYICTTKLGAWCADNAIPHDLGRYHVGRACGEFIGVIDEVATNGYSHTVRVVLLRAMFNDYLRVGDDAVFGDALDFVMREKNEC